MVPPQNIIHLYRLYYFSSFFTIPCDILNLYPNSFKGCNLIKNLYIKIAEDIQNEINAGSYATGKKIPSVRDLSNKYN